MPFSRHQGFREGEEGRGADDAAAQFSPSALTGSRPGPIWWFQVCCFPRTWEVAPLLQVHQQNLLVSSLDSKACLPKRKQEPRVPLAESCLELVLMEDRGKSFCFCGNWLKTLLPRDHPLLRRPYLLSTSGRTLP